MMASKGTYKMPKSYTSGIYCCHVHYMVILWITTANFQINNKLFSFIYDLHVISFLNQ